MYNLTHQEVGEATHSAQGLIPAFRHYDTAQVRAAIGKMHEMYSLPVSFVPTLDNERTEAFTRILQKEVNESKDVMDSVKNYHTIKDTPGALPEDIEEAYTAALTDQADWLNDIIVYCLSEQLRLGIDPFVCIPIIMNSNFTKLGADGLPIMDEDGKVCKGPNFKKPEPTISAVIRAAIAKSQPTS